MMLDDLMVAAKLAAERRDTGNGGVFISLCWDAKTEDWEAYTEWSDKDVIIRHGGTPADAMQALLTALEK